jgi:hypothetical protein
MNYEFDSNLRRFYAGEVPKNLEKSDLNDLKTNTKIVLHEIRVNIQAMKNVTITMEDEALEWVRVQAAKLNVSVSRYLGQVLEEEMRRSNAYEQAMRSACKFESWGASDGAYATRGDIYDRP